jgi:hypothetical protein
VVAGSALFAADQRPDGVSSANLEARQPLRLLVLHIDGGDLRAAWPAPAERDQLLDRVGVAFEDGLDSALARVTNPTGYPCRLGAPPRAVPEEDSLDLAPNDDPPAGQPLLLLVL